MKNDTNNERRNKKISSKSVIDINEDFDEINFKLEKLINNNSISNEKCREIISTLNKLIEKI